MQLLRGVWTPWATVWCLPCDLKLGKRTTPGGRVRNIPADPAALVEREDEFDGPARCDECGAMCWARHDVSLLQAIGYAFNERTWEGAFAANLAQTGGMCCALIVEFSEPSTRRIYVTAMDGPVTIGDYASEDAVCEGRETSIVDIPETDPATMIRVAVDTLVGLVGKAA